MARPTRLLAAALVIAALLAGCGGDGSGGGRGDALPTTTADAASNGASATTSTSSDDGSAPTTTTDTGAGAACPDDDPLAAATSVSEAALDIDGDGVDDAVGAGQVDGDWVLVAELSTGGVAIGAVSDTGGPVAVRPLGGAPIDDEPGAELVVQTGAGAAAFLVGIHRLDGCELVALQLGADAARFPVGATVTRADGVSCPPTGGLVHRSAESLDGVTFDVVEVRYVVEGDDLVEASRDTATLGPDDPGFTALARLDCGTARLG